MPVSFLLSNYQQFLFGGIILRQRGGRNQEAQDLRMRKGRVNYRILYFFHGRNLAILGHALTKEDKVSKADIERAVRRKKAFEADPVKHSRSEEE